MEAFADVLAVGGRSNSPGRSAEVATAVLADPGRVRELLDCAYDEDARVRMRAMDVLEKVGRQDPAVVEPLVEEMLPRLTGSEQASVQWHLAQLLRVVRLTGAQQQTSLPWLRSRVATPDADWIARSR